MMLGWMLRLLCSPWDFDQAKNPAGSGNFAVSNCQPFHVSGALKSVSVTRTSSGTPSLRNRGRIVSR